jgi:hypothetical protein
MLAVRMPIAGILIAMLVLVGEVAALKAYSADHHHHRHHPHMNIPQAGRPHFGRHRGCADKLRISGPDDFAPMAH